MGLRIFGRHDAAMLITNVSREQIRRHDEISLFRASIPLFTGYSCARLRIQVADMIFAIAALMRRKPYDTCAHAAAMPSSTPLSPRPTAEDERSTTEESASHNIGMTQEQRIALVFLSAADFISLRHSL